MPPKKSKRQTIYEVLTTNYVFNLRNDENLAQIFNLRLNLAKVIVFFVLFIVLSSIVSIYIYKIFDSFYSDEIRKEQSFKRKIKNLNMEIDSIRFELAQRDSFMQSLKIMLSGEGEAEMVRNIKNKQKEEITRVKHEDKMLSAEVILRRQFETNENYKPSSKSKTQKKEVENANILFFTPANGYISKKYNDNHFGIDIVSNTNEPIKSIADGTVVYSGWSYDTGYMILIQHNENYISVYKHNAELLKKLGEPVKSGEIIALMGNSGESSTGTHLHFEIWLNGRPVDPTQYIVF